MAFEIMSLPSDMQKPSSVVHFQLIYIGDASILKVSAPIKNTLKYGSGIFHMHNFSIHTESTSELLMEGQSVDLLQAANCLITQTCWFYCCELLAPYHDINGGSVCLTGCRHLDKVVKLVTIAPSHI